MSPVSSGRHTVHVGFVKGSLAVCAYLVQQEGWLTLVVVVLQHLLLHLVRVDLWKHGCVRGASRLLRLQPNEPHDRLRAEGMLCRPSCTHCVELDWPVTVVEE